MKSNRGFNATTSMVQFVSSIVLAIDYQLPLSQMVITPLVNLQVYFGNVVPLSPATTRRPPSLVPSAFAIRWRLSFTRARNKKPATRKWRVEVFVGCGALLYGVIASLNNPDIIDEYPKSIVIDVVLTVELHLDRDDLPCEF